MLREGYWRKMGGVWQRASTLLGFFVVKSDRASTTQLSSDWVEPAREIVRGWLLKGSSGRGKLSLRGELSREEEKDTLRARGCFSLGL